MITYPNSVLADSAFVAQNEVAWLLHAPVTHVRSMQVINVVIISLVSMAGKCRPHKDRSAHRGRPGEEEAHDSGECTLEPR
jgi:hypothetical protein